MRENPGLVIPFSSPSKFKAGQRNECDCPDFALERQNHEPQEPEATDNQLCQVIDGIPAIPTAGIKTMYLSALLNAAPNYTAHQNLNARAILCTLLDNRIRQIKMLINLKNLKKIA